MIGGALALSAGCDPEPSPFHEADASHVACNLPFVGDATKDASIELTALGPDAVSHVLSEGADVPLIFPPQGGRVIFVGVEAMNVDPCNVEITGALGDTTTKQVRIDGRTVNLAPSPSGYGASVDTDISTFSNIPACPNQWASTDVYDHPFQLTLTLVDRSGRKASKSIGVVPKCAEPDKLAECLCICKKGYVLGEMCGDAGAP
jgi:hypothetical protein